MAIQLFNSKADRNLKLIISINGRTASRRLVPAGQGKVHPRLREQNRQTLRAAIVWGVDKARVHWSQVWWAGRQVKARPGCRDRVLLAMSKSWPLIVEEVESRTGSRYEEVRWPGCVLKDPFNAYYRQPGRIVKQGMRDWNKRGCPIIQKRELWFEQEWMEEGKVWGRGVAFQRETQWASCMDWLELMMDKTSKMVKHLGHGSGGGRCPSQWPRRWRKEWWDWLSMGSRRAPRKGVQWPWRRHLGRCYASQPLPQSSALGMSGHCPERAPSPSAEEAPRARAHVGKAKPDVFPLTLLVYLSESSRSVNCSNTTGRQRADLKLGKKWVSSFLLVVWQEKLETRMDGTVPSHLCPHWQSRGNCEDH